MMSDSLRQHLTDEGYAVDVSSSGTKTIDLFDGGAHHLVICELQLPDIEKFVIERTLQRTGDSKDYAFAGEAI